VGVGLVTGGIGAGKTCMVVARDIQGHQGEEVEYEDQFGQMQKATRRIIVAGVRGLVVPHERLPHSLTGEVIDKKKVAEWNRVDGNDEPVYKRLPGEPPLDVECCLHNWWMWARPGDLIVCDEVQYIVPRGVLGREPPHYIKSIEVSRHYGVDFVFITQHPQLLDTTMRNLVTQHRHVRSVLGSPLCMVYTWDHASNTERITNASKGKFWRAPKYFKLYKSTVSVVKQPTAGRGAVLAVPALLAFGGWRLYSHLHPHDADQAAAVASTSTSSPAGSALASSVASGRVSVKFPVYEPEAVRADREPYEGRALQLEGGYSIGPSQVVYFGLLIDGQRVATLSLQQLVRMGYTFVSVGQCSGLLQYRGGRERPITCGKAVESHQAQQQAATPAAPAPDAAASASRGFSVT
jgi:zona occludens toxin (predicted ATPase)